MAANGELKMRMGEFMAHFKISQEFSGNNEKNHE
jgi:hypothetical protein